MPSAVNLVPQGLTSSEEAYVPGALRVDGQLALGANVPINVTGTLGASTKSPESTSEDDWLPVAVNGTTLYAPLYAAS